MFLIHVYRYRTNLRALNCEPFVKYDLITDSGGAGKKN